MLCTHPTQTYSTLYEYWGPFRSWPSKKYFPIVALSVIRKCPRVNQGLRLAIALFEIPYYSTNGGRYVLLGRWLKSQLSYCTLSWTDLLSLSFFYICQVWLTLGHIRVTYLHWQYTVQHRLCVSHWDFSRVIDSNSWNITAIDISWRGRSVNSVT